MVSLIAGILSFVLLLIVFSIISFKVNLAVLFTAFVIATANVITGAWFIDKAMGKPNKTFLIMVFGSMFVRMFLILLITLTVVLGFGVDVSEFIFILFGFYVFYLILELKFLMDRINHIKKVKQQNTV